MNQLNQFQIDVLTAHARVQSNVDGGCVLSVDELTELLRVYRLAMSVAPDALLDALLEHLFPGEEA